ncbi:chemotaxis protein CheY [Paenibacillus swuensis]|uniref:Protein-glutamate methylesterase/protein-glutamine glutaminase n=1 Tax=Paenibacillus swuensis TaxID=1178515 RepID=A0A172TKR0_9BACL|nr:chemotaxis response regulator protein-glutamate methylesterase [Paenibacillus swuensis]ANE47556.1 chemotaxis protein CheY [Paenibacillus swuensis]
MAQYQVLVVDDSAFMRKVISDLIEEDPLFTVMGTAKTGREAIAKVKELRPDAVTMDVEMPEMNGLDALKHIMEETPVPVIMLSSLTSDGARETILALERGAVDFVRKPSGSISLDVFKVKLLLHEKLRIAVAVNLKSRTMSSVKVAKDELVVLSDAGSRLPTRQSVPAVLKPNRIGPVQKLVAIGTSTGGPRALQQVLSALPEHFPAPILIVQHMPPKFTHSLALRLDSLSRIRVVEAEDGQELRNGTAYIAPGGWHMHLAKNDRTSGYQVKLTKEEPRSGHRPSVDVLFESLLPYVTTLPIHTVLMTGMGSDGAKGMKALKAAGSHASIAESEETCVVYGMPRSAVEQQCVDYVLPVTEIPRKLTELLPST